MKEYKYKIKNLYLDSFPEKERFPPIPPFFFRIPPHGSAPAIGSAAGQAEATGIAEFQIIPSAGQAAFLPPGKAVPPLLPAGKRAPFPSAAACTPLRSIAPARFPCDRKRNSGTGDDRRRSGTGNLPPIQ